MKKLPFDNNFFTPEIAKQLVMSHRALAQLKGYSHILSNQHILINAVMLNEAKNSAEIENIVSTHDEIYQALVLKNATSEGKEIVNYRSALWYGYQFIKENGFLSINAIIMIQTMLEANNAGIRRLPGTVLKNALTDEIVYTPPSNYDEIIDLFSNLESYLNDDHDLDDLIKMALIHYQFESIHPFYDGNGRTGRIINVLYLMLKGLIDAPIIYISKYINENKGSYYHYLRIARDGENLEPFVLYMLKAVEETAISTFKTVKAIVQLLDELKLEIKEKLPKIYSHELIDALFYDFYTKINYVETRLSVTRKTAASYLSQLEKKGILTSKMIGKERVYTNQRLYDLIKNINFSGD